MEAYCLKCKGPHEIKDPKEITLKNKTLYIKLSSPALKQELSYGKEKLKNLMDTIATKQRTTE